MSGSSSGPQDSGASGEFRHAESPAPADLDPALLRQVIERTLSNVDAHLTVESLDLNRLKAVARRRQGQQLTLEPVAVELVRAILSPQFAGLDEQPELFMEMTSQIARSLIDDPVARERLAELWKRLSEL